MIEQRAPAVGILCKRSEFEAVLRFGIRLASRNFVLHARANENLHPRLGIIASRKAASRAVDRNRGKRLIRETFRATGAALGGYDVTIQLRSDLRRQDNTVVRTELRSLLEALARRCAGKSGAPAPQARATRNGE